VERHAALPDREDLERMLQEVGALVEDDIAQAAAEDHPEDAVEEQVVEVIARDRRAAGGNAARAEPPERTERGEVHEAVPADRQRADREGDRIEIGMYEHGAMLLAIDCRGLKASRPSPRVAQARQTGAARASAQLILAGIRRQR